MPLPNFTEPVSDEELAGCITFVGNRVLAVAWFFFLCFLVYYVIAAVI